MTPEKALNNIVSTLENRINTYNKVQLPALEAIKATAAKFDGKAFNRRFTAAVTKALESNSTRITVDFSTTWDNKTEYDIIRISYRNADGSYECFKLYPDRAKIKDYIAGAVAVLLVALFLYSLLIIGFSLGFTM